MSGADLAGRRARLTGERRALLERRLRGRPQAPAAGAAAPSEPWVPPALDDPASLGEPAAWSRLEEVAREAAAAAASDPELGAEAADEPRVERLAAALLAGALRLLGAFGEAGEESSAAALGERLGVSPRHRKVLPRWLASLAEEGWLNRRGDLYRAPRPLPAEDWKRLRRADEGHLDPAVLAALLTGERHALELFLADGSSAQLEAAYREAPMFRYCNRVAAAAVSAWVAALPPERPLRLLEVGAGTGGTSAALLPLFPADRTHYLYTDVTPFFLDLGRGKFTDFPFVRYALLDLERDPEGQGLPPGRFDLIVAAHVLHATRRIAETLDHVAALLAPGGLLLLLEETRFRRLFHFSMGFLPGFDRFEDAGLRRLHPLLDAGGWRRELMAAGFDAVFATTAADSPAATVGVDVLVARFATTSPLAVAQERLWHFERRHPGTSCYHVVSPIRLAGPLVLGRLAGALAALVERHGALRTTFEEGPSGPLQRLRPAWRPQVPTIDLARLPQERRTAEAERCLARAAAPRFDLCRGPLLRAGLLRLAAEEHVLHLTCPHLVTDGGSSLGAAADLARLYHGRAGEPPPADAYRRWARRGRRRAAGKGDPDTEFWRRKLAAGPDPLELPRRPPGGVAFRRGVASFTVEAGAVAPLRALAREERTTLFVVLLAVVKAVLAPYAASGQVRVAVPFSLRDDPELDAVVGNFVTLLPVRTKVASDPPFRDFLGRVRDATAAAFAHPRLSHATLLEELGEAALDLAGGVMFNLPGTEVEGHSQAPPAGLRFEPRGSFELGTEVDLAVYAAAVGGGLHFDLAFRLDRLGSPWVGALARRLAALVASAAADPGRRLSELAGGPVGDGKR